MLEGNNAKRKRKKNARPNKTEQTNSCVSILKRNCVKIVRNRLFFSLTFRW